MKLYLVEDEGVCFGAAGFAIVRAPGEEQALVIAKATGSFSPAATLTAQELTGDGPAEQIIADCVS